MVEVEIRDFQSIDHIKIRVEGFTALIGRSNIGKSAIVRAVKAALTGAASSSFVRHRAACLRTTKKAKTCKCSTSVHIQTEGFDLLWEKGDAINRYTFNGQVYDKAERGTPDFLQAAYGMVKVGEGKELIQVSDQFHPIFLLNQTGGVVADVLSDVAHLDQVNHAMRDVEKDRREAVSTRKVREKDVLELGVRLTDFDGLDETVAQVTEVEQSLKGLESAGRTVQMLDGFLQRRGAVTTYISFLQGVVDLDVPVYTSIVTGVRTLQQVSLFHERLTERVRGLQGLQGLGAVLVPDSSRLSLKAVEQLHRWVGRLQAIKVSMVRIKQISEVPVPVLDLATQKERTSWLTQVVSKWQTLTKHVADLEMRLRAEETEASQIQAEWDALGVCPTCSQPLTGGCREVVDA